MKRFLSIFVFFLPFFIVAPLFASENSEGERHVDFCGGSFVAVRQPPATEIPTLDQFVFHQDGTAYWNQSTALDNPLSEGTFLPGIGSWKQVGNRIILTTITAHGFPELVGLVNDLDVSEWSRATQEFIILDDNTLRIVKRAFSYFDLNQDPLFTPAPGTGGVSCAEFFARRINPNRNDLNQPCLN